MSQGGKFEREGGAPISKYVVDGDGTADYITIQAAMDAADADGGGLVYVRDGLYTENLICYNNVFVRGESILVVVDGIHAPNTIGNLRFANLTLKSATHIFSSVAAGVSAIEIENCIFEITSGFIFDLPSWNGSFRIFDCKETSSNNGISNNTVLASLRIKNSRVGIGTNICLSSGVFELANSRVECPITLQSGSSALINEGTYLQNTLSITGNATCSLFNCTFDTGASTPLSHTSSARIDMGNVTIDTSTSPVITGTGAIETGSLTFMRSDNIAAGITLNKTPPHLYTGELNAENLSNLEFTGFFEWGGGTTYYTLLGGNNFRLDRSGIAYIDSIRLVFLDPQTINIPAAGATYYIYIDPTGTIQQTTARTTTLFEDNIVLFEVLRDSLSNYIVVRENHPYEYPTRTSEWAHNTIGSVIENVLGGANITLNGTKAIQINGNDYLADHGLRTFIPDSGGSPETFNLMFTNGVGKWTLDSATTLFPSSYNNAGVITALGVNKYGIFRLYVSKEDLNSSTPQYFAVFDTQEENNLTQAQARVALDNPAKISAELAQLELAQLGFIIKEQSSDTIVDVIISKETARSGVSGAVPNEGALITLDTSNFDSWLSGADTTAQAAFETLDDVGKGATIDPGASGDSYVQFDINSTGEFRIGVDDDAADAFKISQGSALGTNDTFVMTSAGERTMPLQPAFLATRANQSDVTGNGAVATIICPTVRYDQGSDYNNTTGVFTAPVTGRYHFSASVMFDDFQAANGGFQDFNTSNEIYRSVNIDPGNVASGNGFISVSFSSYADMDAGDTARLQMVYAGNLTDTIDIDVETYFGGALIC